MEVVIEYKAQIAQFEADLNRVKKELGMVDEKATASAKKTGQAFTEAGGKVGSSMQSLIGKVTQVGAAIGIAFSVQQVIQFGAASVHEFAKAERASNQLLFALNGNVVAHKRLIEQAKTLQKTTPFEDDTIVAAQSYLAAQGRTEAQIRKTIAAAVDLSTVTGKDLTTAVSDLNATYEGNVRGLARLDSRLKGFTQTEYENGAAIDLLGEKYKGFAEKDLQSTEGKLKQLANFWGDFKETIGEVVVSFGQLAVAGGKVIKDLFSGGAADPKTAAEQLKYRNTLIADYQKKIAGVETWLKKTNISETNRAANVQLLATYQAELNELTGKSIDQEDDKQKSSKRTIESLTAELTRKRELMDEEEIGSARQIELSKEIKKIEDDITHARGEQTQAEKESAQKREQDNQKKQQAAEKELQRIAAIKEANQNADIEIYKSRQDARNKELVDLDSLARKMQKDGVDQVKIDELIRAQELDINKKYDDLEEAEHKKNQDQMLAELEAQVDADTYTQERITAKQKEEQEKRLKSFQQYSDAVSELIHSVFELNAALNEQEIQDIDNRQKAELEALDAKHGIKKEKETAYEREKRQIEERFEKERAEVKRKQAIADKALAIFNIGVDTARAVVAMLASPPPFNFVLAALVGAAAAAQLAAVVAKPIPAFEKGGRVKGGRQAIQVNEKGEESVMNAEATRKYSKEIEAMNSGRWEQYITSTKVMDLISLANTRREKLNNRERNELKQIIKAEIDDTGLRHDIQRNKTVELGPKTVRRLSRGMQGSNDRFTP